jgi:hypothetical protein
MSPLELKVAWGEQPMIYLRDDLAFTLPFAEATKDFLREIGLPSPLVFYSFISLQESIVRLTDYPIVTDLAQSMSSALNLWVLGVRGYFPDVFADYVCLDSESDEVILVGGSDYIVFINSNVSLFCESLLILQQEFLDKSPGDGAMNDSEIDRRYRRTASNIYRRIRAIDPLALRDDNTHWAAIIHQIGYHYGL